jgi:hypothetical protein
MLYNVAMSLISGNLESAFDIQFIIYSCRLQGSNIEVFCLHPGIIASGLSRHMGLLKYAINYGLYFFSKSAEQVRHGSAALLMLYSQNLSV